ncbi:MAG TPA: hypothetical protein VIR00_04415 [Micromonosporaceae bacterium]
MIEGHGIVDAGVAAGRDAGDLRTDEYGGYGGYGAGEQHADARAEVFVGAPSIAPPIAALPMKTSSTCP